MMKAPKIGIPATVNPDVKEVEEKESMITCIMSATRIVDLPGVVGTRRALIRDSGKIKCFSNKTRVCNVQ